METPHENLYLKQYVKRHPDNQMAWYLLGKQYVALNKEAKANYCFLQAGEVYEAFEQKRHPLAGEPEVLVRAWARRQRHRRLASRAAGLALVLLLIVLWGPSFTNTPGSKDEVMTAEQGEGWKQTGVWLLPYGQTRPIGEAWQAILSAPDQPVWSIAVRLEEEEGWRKWTGRTRVLMSARRTNEGGVFTLKMYDEKLCHCQPSDARSAYEAVQKWSREQEDRLTLSSAIYQYHSLYGRWPVKLGDLMKSYPLNVMAGEAPGMQAMFATVLQQMKLREDAQAGTGGKAGQEQPGSSAASQISEHYLTGPLAIIVDKDTHRLAVVSGDIIIRSYPVGLGGDRTPEGKFRISEKVKNPNGTDEGPYGSRGMTLSNSLYAIHGTDEPDSIGEDNSKGCVRMLREDLEELYDIVPLGTEVRIRNGTLPSDSGASAKRFKLEPRRTESNPGKLYRWLT
ncbi:L,D-transpeptidase [Paenibacillus sp. GCM10023252]|uniref:L,D-transpeptidase n=1 Tax=Paenibacillus sp. GCM10023252 TaxID=3252649 RepID=UPI00361DF6B0